MLRRRPLGPLEDLVTGQEQRLGVGISTLSAQAAAKQAPRVGRAPVALGQSRAEPLQRFEEQRLRLPGFALIRQDQTQESERAADIGTAGWQAPAATCQHG